MGTYFISHRFEFMAQQQLSAPPSKKRKVLSDATNTIQNVSTEEESSSQSMDQDHKDWEDHIKQGVEEWLAMHGPKLFALEASKFLAKEQRKKDLRSIR